MNHRTAGSAALLLEVAGLEAVRSVPRLALLWRCRVCDWLDARHHAHFGSCFGSGWLVASTVVHGHVRRCIRQPFFQPASVETRCG